MQRDQVAVIFNPVPLSESLRVPKPGYDHLLVVVDHRIVGPPRIVRVKGPPGPAVFVGPDDVYQVLPIRPQPSARSAAVGGCDPQITPGHGAERAHKTPVARLGPIPRRLILRLILREII